MAWMRVWLGAELRRHWRRQVVLALCIGVAAGAVVTLAAASRRTATLYDRFERTHGVAQAEISDSDLDGAQLEALGRAPGVESAGAYAPLFFAPDRPNVLPGQDAVVF